MTVNSRIVGAVLAAGLATRFGSDKLLHPLDGKPLAAHIADTLVALPVPHRLAVCAAGHPERVYLFARRGFVVVENPEPARGLASSLALAAQWALARDAEGLLVCLADMPNVTVEHLNQLVAAGIDDGIAATEAAGVRGPPAMFARALVPSLTTLTGDRGARDLIADATAVTASPALVKDFDTRADFG